jgi:V/A-type H+-transporting ATPase subunit D
MASYNGFPGHSPGGSGHVAGSHGPADRSGCGRFEALLELLLDAASAELLLRRLAGALTRTSRQVNTLERRVAPERGSAVRQVRAQLEEREREDHTRLQHLRKTRD